MSTKLRDPTRTAAAPPRRRRRWPWLVAGAVALLMVVAALPGPEDGKRGDRATRLGTTAPTATPVRTATADRGVRAAAKRLIRRGEYRAAAGAYESADLDDEAARVRRRGARVLSRSARRALARERYASARRLALESRGLHPSAAAATVLSAANARIAAARARERLARDRRTCSSAERRTVRDGGGTPAGCTAYAAELAAARAAEAATRDDVPERDCDPNYAGACLKPGSPDYDCAGGSGDGPDYTGTVRVVGADPYDLDRDGDGIACDP